MKVYVVSRSSNRNFALNEGVLIEVCPGVAGWEDALSYAKDHAKATDEPSWVYEVDLKAVHTFKVEKQVVGRAIAQ